MNDAFDAGYGAFDLVQLPELRPDEDFVLCQIGGRSEIAQADVGINVSEQLAQPGSYSSRRAGDQNGLHSEYPPSTTRVCAVTMVASAHRNTMAAAISAGVHARLRSVRSIEACLRAAGHARVHSVSTKPGATALTRASGARARARFLVRLIKPALLAPYAMLDPGMLRPATDAVLQTAPRAARKAGAAARVHRNGPSRLVIKMVCQKGSSSRSSSAGAMGSTVAGVPALLTRKSSRPSTSMAFPTIFSAAPGLDTSPGTATAAWPCARNL